ncbi:Ig-like domain-containing protein [Winogradskyella sp. A3E31]|uniref:Ig-like domain-containing protein n=1 Tax=Winogradskyella sp. A3E31 TaxID=3349637 RepID=UPI00398B0F1A
MKKITLLFFLVSTSLCFNCIGEDVINDEVTPEVRILNPIESLSVSETYQLNATFFNNVGQIENSTINWSSSNENVATIDENGVISGLSEGESTIKASVNFNNSLVEDSSTITVIMGEVDTPNTSGKSGIIETTSSYTLTGSFTLSEIENSDDLLLSIAEDYNASTSLPGLYLYLTNNPNSVANALSLGPVVVFNGAHSYTITDTGINDYSYLLYWCEPFSVKVGGGTIDD